MKITLPAILKVPRFRADKSLTLSFDTRELGSDEALVVLSLAGSEGYLLFAPNEISEKDIPTEPAEVESKTQAQRIRSVLYILYKQETERAKFVGSFDSFYKEKTEKYIEHLKGKIE